MNLKHFMKSNRNIIGKSARIENFLLHSSCESFMELGMSHNNNLLLPLANAIVENNLENSNILLGIIYMTVHRFNEYITYYPEYSKYLLEHTEYQTGLEQTYLRVYQKQQFFAMIIYFNKLFIDHPSLMFVINLYKQGVKN